ncbi:3-keto-disaccharide hydrolase [Tenacibaculum xiamenense]|uniref:3-keto-disaccharide hydrolase n=1 Tax=Tenacibaculum xiamenense TaxID=1261553 RepID=UPI0038B57EB5
MNYFKAIIFTFLFVILSVSCKKENNFLKEIESDWLIKGNANWSFSNNIIRGEINEGDGFMYSKKRYRNFVLKVEFKPDSTINSGVFIRCKNDSINPLNCYEFNIWDNHPKQEFRTGSVVLKSFPLAKVNTVGKWNTYKIKCVDNHLQAWINNVLVADLVDENLAEGYLGLQASGNGTVQFRNMKLN